MPRFEEAKQFILDKLASQLSPRLCYHAAPHTADDVVPAVECLASLEGVCGDDRIILLTAALLHDSGFLRQYMFNESVGVEIARGILPRFDYTDTEIDAVSEIILATSLPQRPSGLLEEIMCDGDLDSLGREDYFITSQMLRLERIRYGYANPLVEWYGKQREFLRQHHYFTASARMLRGPTKEKNLRELECLLEARAD